MKKRGKEKKQKLPFRKVWSNNLFLLKIIGKTAPMLLPYLTLTMIFGAAVEFFSSTYMLRFAINGLQEGKEFSVILTGILLLFGLQTVNIVISRLYYELYSPVRMERITRRMKTQVYEKAASIELARYENPEYYDSFVKAIDECSSRAWSILTTFGDLVWFLVSYTANFAFLVALDPVLLLFALVPLFAAPLKSKENKAKYRRNMELKEEGRRENYSRRTFYLADYAKEMRLTQMPELMLRRFRESGARARDIMRKSGVPVAVFWYILKILNDVVVSLGAALYCVWRTLGVGAMGYGDCLVAVNAVETVGWSLSRSVGILTEFQEHALYTENLRNFLEYEPTLQGGEDSIPPTGDLVLQGVSFRYDGAEDYALRDISLRFGAKEKIAIVGHNGAGKSTLIKLLLRLYEGEGTVTYADKEISSFPVGEYRNMFSVVLQDFHLFSFPVADNVLLRLRREGDGELVEDSLKKAGLWEKVSQFSQGTETIITREFDKDGAVLSGGEAQKLAIAHVYSKQNRFVILDEPSGALDPLAEHEMYLRMADACKDCGMIFISHRLSSAVSADRIYLMEQGRVAEVGTHEELMAQNGRYAEMFRRQAANYGEVEA